MNERLQERLRASRPEDLAPPDVEALRRRGRRRRQVRHGAVATAGMATVVAGVALIANLATPAVTIGDPAGSGASTTAPATPSPDLGERQADDWNAMTFAQALTLLADRAEQQGGPSELGENQVREVVARGVAFRGVTDEDGTRSWLQPWAVTLQVRADGTVRRGEHEFDRHLEVGTRLAALREELSHLEAAAVPADAPVETLRDPEAMDEAERLAEAPVREAPTEAGTERPDRAYALVRAADALGQAVAHPGASDLHDRLFDVLRQVGTDWLVYRGTVTDVLGRERIGIGALDPANNTETLLLFDPNTGWYTAELDLLHDRDVTTLRTDGTRTPLPDDATVSGASAFTVNIFDEHS